MDTTMPTTEMAPPPPISTDGWTYEQKQDVLRRLFGQVVGAQLLEPGTGFAVVPMESANEIGAGCFDTLQVSPHIDFKPERLIIFENYTERVAHDLVEEFEEKTTGPFWSQTVERVVVKRTTVERREQYLHTNDCWEISGIFVGNRSQLINTVGIRGSLFGRDGQVKFLGDVALRGLSISVSVKNTGPHAARFHGAVLGKVMDRDWQKAEA